jgi:sugar lactone lactonase YvrE
MRSSLATAVAVSSTVALALLAGCHGDSTKPNTPGKSPHPAAGSAVQGQLEVVHQFNGPMPTGVTVSRDNRIFVNYPRWEDPIQFTVAEIKGGREVPYPDEATNRGDNPDTLFSVQSVVVDPRNRLWALDTGSVDMGPIKGPEWVKLVGIDLSTNKIFKTIRFPQGVITPNSYINDVRFDLRRGEDGVAFITDSSGQGDNGIIVVDLASGRSWRKLHKHPAVTADRTFVAVMEGKPLMLNKKGEAPRQALIGSDGIAISADGSRLFFCPLSSRNLYSVSVDALADEKSSDDQVAATLRKEKRKFASDGLESDSQGRVYLTDWEHNAIQLRTGENQYQTLVTDPRMWWPDTLSLATDGKLYFTANQLHRQAKFHDGQDLRRKPYYLFRIQTDGRPVTLTK